MSTNLGKSTRLISHSLDLTELDFIVQNIEYSLRVKGIRLHGVLSPFSKTYENTAMALEKITKKLKSVYGLNSLIVDISMSGDLGVLNSIKNSDMKLSDSGIYSNDEVSYLLLNTSLERSDSKLLEDLIFWKTIDEAKKHFDLLFFLPSLKNNSIIEQLEINPQAQWLMVEKKYAAKIFKNLKKQTHFQVPFLGLVTV